MIINFSTQAILQNDFDFVCTLLANNLKFKLRQSSSPSSSLYDTFTIFHKDGNNNNSALTMQTLTSRHVGDSDSKIANSNSGSSIEAIILSRYIDYIIQLNDNKDVHLYGYPVGLVLSWLLHSNQFGKCCFYYRPL